MTWHHSLFFSCLKYYWRVCRRLRTCFSTANPTNERENEQSSSNVAWHVWTRARQVLFAFTSVRNVIVLQRLWMRFCRPKRNSITTNTRFIGEVERIQVWLLSRKGNHNKTDAAHQQTKVSPSKNYFILPIIDLTKTRVLPKADFNEHR